MSGRSPTESTLLALRREGWPLVQVVEHWNSHARVRNDLFGIIDVLAVNDDGDVLAVQATSYTNVSARCRKITASPALAPLARAGWTVEVWGWRKVKGRWTDRRVTL